MKSDEHGRCGTRRLTLRNGECDPRRSNGSLPERPGEIARSNQSLEQHAFAVTNPDNAESNPGHFLVSAMSHSRGVNAFPRWVPHLFSLRRNRTGLEPAGFRARKKRHHNCLNPNFLSISVNSRMPNFSGIPQLVFGSCSGPLATEPGTTTSKNPDPGTNGGRSGRIL